VCRLLVTANVPSSHILVTLMMEALSPSETSVLTTATQRKIPEDSVLWKPRILHLRYCMPSQWMHHWLPEYTHRCSNVHNLYSSAQFGSLELWQVVVLAQPVINYCVYDLHFPLHIYNLCDTAEVQWFVFTSLTSQVFMIQIKLLCTNVRLFGK
jgi:hypothetical protein